MLNSSARLSRTDKIDARGRERAEEVTEIIAHGDTIDAYKLMALIEDPYMTEADNAAVHHHLTQMRLPPDIPEPHRTSRTKILKRIIDMYKRLKPADFQVFNYNNRHERSSEQFSTILSSSLPLTRNRITRIISNSLIAKENERLSFANALEKRPVQPLNGMPTSEHLQRTLLQKDLIAALRGDIEVESEDYPQSEEVIVRNAVHRILGIVESEVTPA